MPDVFMSGQASAPRRQLRRPTKKGRCRLHGAERGPRAETLAGHQLPNLGGQLLKVRRTEAPPRRADADFRKFFCTPPDLRMIQGLSATRARPLAPAPFLFLSNCFQTAAGHRITLPQLRTTREICGFPRRAYYFPQRARGWPRRACGSPRRTQLATCCKLRPQPQASVPHAPRPS